MAVEAGPQNLTLVDKIIAGLDAPYNKQAIYRAPSVAFEPLNTDWGDFARERVDICLAPVDSTFWWEGNKLNTVIVDLKNTLAMATEGMMGELEGAHYRRIGSIRRNVLDVPSLTYTEPDAVTVTTAVTNKPPHYVVLTTGEDQMDNYQPSSETFPRLIVMRMFPHPILADAAALEQQKLKGDLLSAQGLAAGRIRLNELEVFKSGLIFPALQEVQHGLIKPG